MSTLLEMTANIVMAHAAASKLTSEELNEDLEKVYAALHGLGSGQSMGSSEKPKTVLTVRQAFKKDEVICMVCGKGGMKTVTRHLKSAHDLKPRAYRKQFGIPSSQSLSAESFSEFRRAMALERGLADKLIKAREVRASYILEKKAAASNPAGQLNRFP